MVAPPWIASLPKLSAGPRATFGPKGRPARHRRLPSIPASFPGETAGDPVRALALALRRRCAICGCSLPLGSVWQVWNSSRGEDWPGGVYMSRLGPVHQSCAVYSAMVCPWLQYPTSQTRYDPESGKTKRGEAAIVQFGRYGIFFGNGGTRATWSIGHYDLAEYAPFGASTELESLYTEAVSADVKVIDLSSRLYWGAGDTGRLLECARSDQLSLSRLRASAFTQVNGYNYRLALL